MMDPAKYKHKPTDVKLRPGLLLSLIHPLAFKNETRTTKCDALYRLSHNIHTTDDSFIMLVFFLKDQEKKDFQRFFLIQINQHKTLALICPVTEEFSN